jgi:hypothetical protein
VLLSNRAFIGELLKQYAPETYKKRFSRAA